MTTLLHNTDKKVTISMQMAKISLFKRGIKNPTEDEIKWELELLYAHADHSNFDELAKVLSSGLKSLGK